MIIERAALSDLDAVYRLTNELEERELPLADFGQTYEALLCSPCDHIFVLREGEIRGYVHVRLAPQLHHAAPIAEVQELVVSAGGRGQGLGRELLAFALAFCKESGARQAELTSNFTRSSAHRFYEREGFQKTSYKYVKAL